MADKHILIVDDEPDICDLVAEILADEGYVTHVANSAEQARSMIGEQLPDLVLLDVWMPNEDGISLLKSWQLLKVQRFPVIMMSGHGTLETAIEATKNGAYDFIEKPLSMAKLLLMTRNAINSNSAQQENQWLKTQQKPIEPPIGSSAVVRQIKAQCEQAAKHGQLSFLTGEYGVGKKSFAKYIHDNSPQRDRPFVEIDLSAYKPEIHSELLFGSEMADGIEQGRLDSLLKGSAYLSNIELLHPDAQRQLHSVITQQQFIRIGGKLPVPAQVRLILSSSNSLSEDVASGSFDKALSMVLQSSQIEVPPLSERTGDVPELIEFYVQYFSSEENLPYRHFSIASQNQLMNHPWHGHIIELKNFIQRVLIHGQEPEVDEDEIIDQLAQISSVKTPQTIEVEAEAALDAVIGHFDLPLKAAREKFEHDYLRHQIKQFHGNISQVAKHIGVERTHLYRKLKSLGIDPKQMH